MEQAFPDASVTGYAGLTDKLRCDPKDRHVLAAAIVGGCQVIVTFNTKDFPPESVEEFGIGDFVDEVRHRLGSFASESAHP